MRRVFLSASVVLTGGLALAIGSLLATSQALGEVEEAWTVTYDGPSRSLDSPTAVAASGQGGWVVTGYSCRGGGDCQAVTIRYDPEGHEVWLARVGDPSTATTHPHFLAVDDAGDVYVCGNGGRFGSGLFLVRYDGRTGSELWLRFHEVEGYSSRTAAGMALDGSGNIVIAGTATEPGDGGGRIAVYKYDRDGELLWQTLLGGPTWSEHEAMDMALDPSGRVLILARGRRSGEDSSGFLVLSCGPDGSEGAAFDIHESIQYASRIAVDRTGNIHIATSEYADDLFLAFLTYDPQGQPLHRFELWIPANGAEALLTDSRGLVYAVGSTSYGSQLFAVCIDPSKSDLEGHLVYEAGEGIFTEWDGTTAAALDATGNLHVACASEGRFVALKLGPDGQVLWTARSEGLSPLDTGGPVIAVDREGRACVAAPTESAGQNTDFDTMALDPEGGALWEVRFDDAGSARDQAYRLLVDADGSAISLGVSESLERSGDIVVLKHALDGSLAWATRYGSDGGCTYEAPAAMVLDDEGSVYVAGSGESTPGIIDGLTLKLASDGHLLWAARRVGSGFSTSIAVDAQGRAHVSGASEVVKYDPEGHELWSASLAPAYGESAIALGHDGAVVACSWTRDDDARLTDLVTLKLDSDGSPLWTAREPLGNAISVYSGAAAVLPGEVRVAAQYLLSGTDQTRLIIASYDAEGERVWARTHGDEVTHFGGGSMLFDANGALHAAGVLRRQSEHQNDMATWKFDAQGRLDWLETYDGQAGQNDVAAALCLDRIGNVYVTGTEEAAEWPPFVTTIKYSPEGQRFWVKKLTRPPAAYVYSSAIAADGRGGVWIAGSLLPAAETTDILFVKYASVAIPFLRGDFDGDGMVAGNVTDPVFLLSYQFLGGPAPPCLAACDANADSRVDLSDAIYLLQFSFVGGAPPPPPFPDCGMDADTEFECATPGC